MLITSNRNVGEWGTVFADPVVATAILDRLLHHSHVVTIRGESYRLRAKRRSGLLQKPVAAQEPAQAACPPDAPRAAAFSLRSATLHSERTPARDPNQPDARQKGVSSSCRQRGQFRMSLDSYKSRTATRLAARWRRLVGSWWEWRRLPTTDALR